MNDRDLTLLVDIYERAQEAGYVLLPDDYTALGYAAMLVSDYNRVNFVIMQANLACAFLQRDTLQMAKYQDGTYGIR